MFRRKKIPPPLKVEVPQEPELRIPFYLAENLRVALDYIGRLPTVPENVRKTIDEWMTAYSGLLAWWIIQTHGWGGLMVATQEAAEVCERFYEAVGEGVKASETSLFDFLEKDIKDE
ncbi:MAG: hypothetical protein A4E20_11025 [Nitrospira sp. SG-bin2]|uniref:hypothetical protein n=1 Tax=Nitrospira cf. moscoviensis SBR1015 TaxID=96242 RepID=UPI000A0A6140|nr:hypothetical protein [Nitrospira cf. moscoviensis SBR1015]OQW34545.1 MAG: hypothetical protein A4E20_11025 [Nitrospira sp. SG-bin2]